MEVKNFVIPFCNRYRVEFIFITNVTLSTVQNIDFRTVTRWSPEASSNPFKLLSLHLNEGNLDQTGSILLSFPLFSTSNSVLCLDQLQ